MCIFAGMNMIWNLIVSMRPKQWTKNLVLFAGIVFSKRFTDPELVRLSLSGFLVFCGLSGAIYILNDIFDRERDRGHPKKSTRPIAAGKVGPGTAAASAGFLIAALLAVSWILGSEFFVLAAVFVMINLVYSLLLRNVVILDVISISISFLIRAAAGVAVLQKVIPDLEFSPWLWICTLFLSLFLAICKRRNEIANLTSAGDHRVSLRDYSVTLLDQLVSISATASIISYSIYTVWPSTVQKFGTRDLVYTIPFVVFGMMRYLYLVYNRHEGGDPSGVLLTEKAIIVDVFLWFATVMYIIIVR